jgi:preprotein translocase subunit SecF
MIIVTYRKLFFALTGLIVAASLISLAVFHLHLGIDFTGGTLVQVEYAAGRPTAQAVQSSLNAAGFSNYSLRESGATGYALRAQGITNDERANLASTFSVNNTYPATIASLNEIGPTIGVELRNKSLLALALVLSCILLFIAFAFRKVSKPVSSWVYGLIALVTLVHDVIVPVGFYSFLGHVTGAQVDTLFVTAVLTVLGFSIHDTIVVFDRVRENLSINQKQNRKEDFAITAGHALNQTFVRSINTSLTVILTLSALYLLGPASTKVFALTLLVGIIAGTYSSIFLATPLLIAIEKRRQSK